MSSKEETKAPVKAEPKPVEKKEDPAVKELAREIYIEICANNRTQGFKASHYAACAYNAAKAFVEFEPPVE